MNNSNLTVAIENITKTNFKRKYINEILINIYFNKQIISIISFSDITLTVLDSQFLL